MKLPKGITLKGSGKFKVSVQVGGKRTYATAQTLDQAINIRDQMQLGLWNRPHAEGTLKPWRFDEAIDEYVKYRVEVSHSEKQTEKRFKWYKQVLCGFFGNTKTLDEITQRDVLQFADMLTANGYASSTINYFGSLLYQMQKRAYARGRMNVEPRRMPLRKQEVGRTRFLSDDEEWAAIDWYRRTCREDYADLFIFYVDTGFRKAEALELQWQDVDLRNRRITTWKTKTGKPRTIKMTTRVHQILSQLHLRRSNDRSNSDRIFGHIKERKFYRVWLQMRAAIGLEDDEQFVIHMLRHTCATRLVSAGVDLRSVMAWMGHSSLDITMRYAHFIPSKLDDAATALDRRKTA